MPLTIRLEVNRRAVREIRVVNRGAPEDSPEERADSGGVRVYEWGTAAPGRFSGTVQHARRDGIEALAGLVLADFAAAIEAATVPCPADTNGDGDCAICASPYWPWGRGRHPKGAT